MSTGAAIEQAWNERQLAQPLRAAAAQVWTYHEPAIVLGCSQRTMLAAARAHSGIEILLRRSGGGAVLAGPWMLGVSVALPVGHALWSADVVASYRWLGELLAAVLREGRVPASALAPAAARALAPTECLHWACFGGLSPWEVVAAGRKIAGLAQVRTRNAVLLSAGILLAAPDWALLCTALERPAGQVALLQSVTTSWAEQGGDAALAGALAPHLQARLRTALQGVDIGEG